MQVELRKVRTKTARRSGRLARALWMRVAASGGRRHEQGHPVLCGPKPWPFHEPRSSVRAGHGRGALAGAASVSNRQFFDEVSSPVEAGREASPWCREERRNVPTWLPAHAGNRVSGMEVDRLLREDNPLSRSGCRRRRRFLLSRRSFSGPPTPCGAQAAFGCSCRATTEVGSALPSGIGMPGVSTGMRAGEATVLRSSAGFRGNSVEGMPRRVQARAWRRGLRMGLGSRHLSNDSTRRIKFPVSGPACVVVAQSRATCIVTMIHSAPRERNIHRCRMRPICA